MGNHPSTMLMRTREVRKGTDQHTALERDGRSSSSNHGPGAHECTGNNETEKQHIWDLHGSGLEQRGVLWVDRIWGSSLLSVYSVDLDIFVFEMRHESFLLPTACTGGIWIHLPTRPLPHEPLPSTFVEQAPIDSPPLIWLEEKDVDGAKIYSNKPHRLEHKPGVVMLENID